MKSKKSHIKKKKKKQLNIYIMFKYRNFVSWFFGAVFMSMFFAACSDDNVGDNENDSSEEADTLADYTVITLM